MIYGYIVTDLAIESANEKGFGSLADKKTLAYGVEKRSIWIKNAEQAKKIGRDIGKYITFDAREDIYADKYAENYLAKQISTAIKYLVGITKRTSPVLVSGLGNRLIVSDSLGTRCVEKLHVTRDLNASSLQSVCALSTGVSGMTGMQSAEIIGGVVSKIKPCAVILVDSLATSMAKRLGRSFQISSAGIAPGSGVGLDKERIDKSTLGVPAISIGVPMMLTLRTAIYSFIKDYASKQDGTIDEFSLRERLKEESLSNLVVAPKDVDFLVEKASTVVAHAIELAFGIDA